MINVKSVTRWLNPFTKQEVLLFILLFSCYAYFFPRRDWSQNARLDQVLAIVDERTLNIDSYQSNTEDHAFYKGHYYSDKAPGAAFLGIPIYIAFKGLIKNPSINRVLLNLGYFDPLRDSPAKEWDGIPVTENYFASALYFITAFTVALPSAVLGVVFYRSLGRFSSRPPPRIGLTLAYGLATIAFPYSGAFYGHQLAATFVFTAFYLLLRMLDNRPSGKGLALVGMLLGCAVLTEYPIVLIAAALFLYALYRLRDRLQSLWVLLGGLPPLLLLMSFDYVIYGTVLPIGYLKSTYFHKTWHTGLMGLTYPKLDALYGITFSPYRGLFFISPFLLLAIPGFYHFLRERKYRPEAITALSIVLSFLLFYASHSEWTGGWAVGPRHLVSMLPFLTFPIIFFFKNSEVRRWKGILAFCLVALSFFLVWAETISGKSLPPHYFHHPLTDFSVPHYLEGRLARNLGMVIGLPAWYSTLPLLVLLGIGIWLLWKESASEGKGAAGAKETPGPQRLNWGQVVCLAGIALYVIVILILQIRLYLGLHMGICDLGVFDQAMYNSLHGQFLSTTTYCQGQLPASSHVGVSLFSGHIYLIMPIFLPLYALFPHPYTLFFLQALATGIGALAVFLIAKDKLRSELAATCLSLSYLLYPALQRATLNHFISGFHPDNFFPPLFLFSFYFLQKKKYSLFWLLSLLALTIAEYYALPLAALGLFLALTEREKRKIGLVLPLVCSLWFVIATWLILPHFQQGGTSHYISTLKGFSTLFGKSHLVLNFAPLGNYLLYLLAPVAFLPLAAFSTFAMAIPNVLVNLIALSHGDPLPNAPNSWHATPIISIVFIGAIGGLGNIVSRFKSLWQLRLLRVLPVIVVVIALFCNYWTGPLPFSRSVGIIQYKVDRAKAESVEEIRTLFPKDTALAAEFFIGSNFSQRQTLYWFPHHWQEADYVLVDTNPWDWRPVEAANALVGLRRSPNHVLLYSQNDIQLFGRVPGPPIEHTLEVNFGNLVKLLGYNLNTEKIKADDNLQLTLYWQALAEMNTSYHVFTHLIDEDDRILGQKDSPPMNGTHPTTEWKVGEIIVDGYEIWVPPETPPGRYLLETGLYELTTGQRPPVLDTAGTPQDNRVILDKVWIIVE